MNCLPCFFMGLFPLIREKSAPRLWFCDLERSS